MLPNKSEKLLDNIQKFNNNLRKNFDLDKFEARAEELERKYEDRIFSRIVGSGSRILVFSGRDRRIN